jgi:hypothetical protein
MDQYGANNTYAKMRKQKDKERTLKVKFMCNNVFGLDDAFCHEAHLLKKNLLRIVHVKEFSPEV